MLTLILMLACAGSKAGGDSAAVGDGGGLVDGGADGGGADGGGADGGGTDGGGTDGGGADGGGADGGGADSGGGDSGGAAKVTVAWSDTAGIFLQQLGDGGPLTVTNARTLATVKLSPDGALVVASDGLDAYTSEVYNAVTGANTRGLPGRPIGWADATTVVVVEGSAASQGPVSAIDVMTGVETVLLSDTGTTFLDGPKALHDGQLVIGRLDSGSGSSRLLTVDVATATRTGELDQPGQCAPSWTRDGRVVWVGSFADGHLHVAPADLSSQTQLSLGGRLPNVNLGWWTADNQVLVVVPETGMTSGSIDTFYAVDVDADTVRSLSAWTDLGLLAGNVRISDDATRVLYEQGTELWVSDADGAAASRVVSGTGGIQSFDW